MKDLLLRSNPNLESFDDVARELKELKRVLLNLDIYYGKGDPNGIVYSNKGGIYFRRDGNDMENLYTKNTSEGNNGWILQTDNENLSSTLATTGRFLIDLDLTYLTVSTVEVDTGNARDSTNVYNIIISSPITLDITTSGIGGLDTGVEAADTWYAVHIIGDTTDTLPGSAILSVSETSPTLPAGYDVFRRVGWVRNDGGSDFLKFFQVWNSTTRRMYYDENFNVTRVLNNGSATSFTGVDMSDYVPPTGFNVGLFTSFSTQGGNANTTLQLRRNGAVAGNPLFEFAAGVKSNSPILGQLQINCDDDQIIEYKVGNNKNQASLSVVFYDDRL